MAPSVVVNFTSNSAGAGAVSAAGFSSLELVAAGLAGATVFVCANAHPIQTVVNDRVVNNMVDRVCFIEFPFYYSGRFPATGSEIRAAPSRHGRVERSRPRSPGATVARRPLR